MRLVKLLADVTASPYGNPIPGLEALGVEAGDVESLHVTQLTEALRDEEPHTVVIRRMAETLQSEHDILEDLHKCGIRPGVTLTARRGGLGVTLSTGEGPELELSMEAASHLYVAPA